MRIKPITSWSRPRYTAGYGPLQTRFGVDIQDRNGNPIYVKGGGTESVLKISTVWA